MKQVIKKFIITAAVLLFMFQSCVSAMAQPTFEPSPDVGESLRITASEIKADTFSERTGATGESITVAVIDTGIDPAHPDLKLTSGGNPKIVDWVDFTGEGRVDTSASGSGAGGFIKTNTGSISVGSIKSKSGMFHYGFLSEKQLDESGFIGQDLNRDGDANDGFVVVVVDSLVSGIYDTVYVDTNSNLDITDEKPMGVYSKTQSYGLFGKGQEKSSFVIAGISVDGTSVDIGFDGNGHGTHVAGILGANGRIRGIAPGVRLLSLKALGSSGDGSWANIAKAIDYAALKGANIISISIGSLLSMDDGDSFLSQKINNLSVKYNTLFVIAVGNDGPGIGSSAAPGNASEAITVGAYISPEIWNLNYNSLVNYDGLWDFSAMGPRRDGALTPNVIAPGSAVSSVNIWDSEGYFLLDGTSMAAPHVAGAAALLMEHAKSQGVVFTNRSIKAALEQTARPVEGFLPVEQGHGLIDVEKAWELLSTMRNIPKVSASTFNKAAGIGPGLFLNRETPSQLNLKITNLDSAAPVRLGLSSDVDWVKPDRQMVFLPRGKTRTITIKYDVPEKPGIYSTIIKGDDANFPGIELEFPVTVIVPQKLDGENALSYTTSGKVAPARWERIFLNVSDTVAELNLRLSIPKDKSGYFKGRARMHVINPEGRQEFTSSYAGPDLMESKGQVDFNVQNPTPGVWEVVIYGDPSSRDYGLSSSEYTFEAKAKGIVWDEDVWKITVPADKVQNAVTKTFTARNLNSEFTGAVIGAGLAKTNSGTFEDRIKVTDGDITGGPVINVPENALVLEVSLKEHSDPKLDADLYLYYYDEEKREWEQVAESANPETTRESVKLVSPPPGRYTAYVDGYDVPGNTAEVDYNHRVMTDSKAVQVIDEMRVHPPDDEWSFEATVSVPDEPGSYLGYLFIKTDDDKTVSYIPIEVHVAPKQLSVEVVPGLVTPEGRRFITINVFEKETAKAYNGTITVNGRLYEVTAGRVTILKDVSLEPISIIIDSPVIGYYNKAFQIN